VLAGDRDAAVGRDVAMAWDKFGELAEVPPAPLKAPP
jgi:hypothetical protein